MKPMNMNEEGESTPVDIRIFGLAEDSKFASARWEDLWNKGEYAAMFGQDLIGEPTDQTVFPGKSDDDAVLIDLGEMKPEVRFIGVLAMFAGGSDTDKRHIVIPRHSVKGYVIELNEYKIILK